MIIKIICIVIIVLCILSILFMILSLSYVPFGLFILFHKEWKFSHDILKHKNKLHLVEELSDEDNDVFVFRLENIELKYDFNSKNVYVISEDIIIPRYFNDKISKVLDNYLMGTYHY